jgi:hypothetical protein
MRVTEITIPTVDNAGRQCLAAHERFRDWLGVAFGGFTVYSTQGVWRNDQGRVYEEPGATYRLATLDYVSDMLVAKASILFADQEAFYIAEVGTAEIVERKSGGPRSFSNTRGEDGKPIELT